MALVAALAAYGVLTTPFELRGLVLFPAGLALALVAVGVALRLPGALAWGLAACVAAYTAALLAGEGIDLLAPFFAAGLLLAAELAFWSSEERAGREPAELLVRRAVTVLGLAVGTALLGTVLLAGALVRPAGGPAVLALGVAAAVAVLALVARLATTPQADRGRDAG